MARHNQTGIIGENITSTFLKKKGFEVICRNYRKKWGEIDIVAEKDNVLHFVEVKTVSRKAGDENLGKGDRYKPEDNMHPWKLKRLQRAIQTFILEKRLDDKEWQFDLACVYLDQEKRIAKVRMLENIIL